jgi:hypothetical protein
LPWDKVKQTLLVVDKNEGEIKGEIRINQSYKITNRETFKRLLQWDRFILHSISPKRLGLRIINKITSLCQY